MISGLVMTWLNEFAADLIGVGLSLLLVAAYYARHYRRVRRDPSYSIHHVNEVTRQIWVSTVMTSAGKDIMAVQTLRNFIMYPILMVSTAALMIVGTLTLSGQTDTIARSWHVINFVGSHSAELWMLKVICLLACFLTAFFAYAMSIRLANHVLFMVNVPPEQQALHEFLSPAHVAERLNRAGQLVAIGMRAFLFSIPLAFWLFGPVYLLLATAGVVAFLSRLDRHRQGI